MKAAKKSLALVLIVLMVLTMLPLSALAEAEHTVSNQEDLDDALETIPAGETATINLAGSFDYSGGIKIEGRTITFNLNGYTLNVTNNAGHGLEVGSGGNLILIEDGGQFNVNSIGDYYGAYAHDGGQATVTSATANPDANSAGAYAAGATSIIRVTGNVVSGGGIVGDGAYAVDGGAVYVGGDAQGFRGARAAGATEGGISSRVEVTGDAIGAIFGAVAEAGGTVIVDGNASGSIGARARDGGSRVEVSGDAIGSDRYGADAMDGGTVIVGGNAQGGTTGAYASGATEEGVSSRTEVTGNAIGGITDDATDDPYCGAHALDGGVVIVGGRAQAFTVGAYAEGTSEAGDGSLVEVRGDVMGSVGAHAWLGGSVRVSGSVMGITGIIAEGVDSTAWVAGDVMAAWASGSVGAVAIDGGTATIDGAIYNPGEGEVEWVYIKLGEEPIASNEGALGTGADEGYFIYSDENGNIVRVKINGACMIDATVYDTLEEALDEVESGETIKLLKDIDYFVELPDRPGIIITDKTITFDLSGHILNVISSVGHALEVGSGGVVNLSGSGEFNVTSSAGYGVYAHDGGRAEVTNAEGFIGAAAIGDDNYVKIAGNVISRQNAVQVAGERNVVIVRGNASLSGDDRPNTAGIVIQGGSDSTVLIGGNLTVTGTNATGVSLVLGGSVIIQGEYNAPEEAYIVLFSLDDGTPVIASLTAADGLTGKLSSELLDLLELDDADYLVYTDEINAVYVRIPAANTGGGSGPSYISRTLTDSKTGITVSGNRINRRARLAVYPLKLHPGDTCAACNAIRKAQKDGHLILGYDISLTPPATGELTISILVGSQYNGQMVTILHCVNGRLETIIAAVVNGIATFTTSSLSPFAVTTGLLVPDSEVTNPPKTGDAATPLGFIILGFAALCAGYLAIKRRKA